MLRTVIIKIENLLDTIPEKTPEDSKFLLKSNHGKLCRSSIHDRIYWVVVIKTALVAGQRIAATGSQNEDYLKGARCT